MSRTYRRYIFFTFLGIFALTAPLLILYTAGYRYNWERGRIQETGVLLTNYRPTTALLRLNNIVGAKKVPTRFSGLIPGRYTISIEKEGYYPWQKRLWVEPSKTTFAEHMILWKKNIAPTRLNENTPKLIAPSPDGTYIAAVEKEMPTSVLLVDTNPEGSGELIPFPSLTNTEITKLLWSPHGKRLFTETASGEQFVFSMRGGDITPLKKLSSSHLENVIWNADDDDRLYGYRRTPSLRKEYELIEIDLFRGATQIASIGALPNMPPYFIEDDLFYRVEQGILSITSFTAPKQALERRLALPDAPTSKVSFLSNSPDDMITLFDQGHKRILLIDKGTATLYPIQETIDGVIAAAWSPQKNRLLWNTGKALSLLDLERSSREVIVEENKKIQDMAWDPENEYIFYTTDDTVIVTEIDNRDVRNRISLATIPELRELFVNHDGRTLWTTGVGEGKNGLLFLTVTER